MSVTLKSLYTDFRQRYGHFGAVYENDEAFMAERQSIIEDALDGFEGAEYFKTWWDMSDRSAKLGGITEGDPIPSLIFLRCVDELIRHGLAPHAREEMRPVFFASLETGRSMAAGGTYRVLKGMRRDVAEVKQNAPMTAEFRGFWDTMNYLRQYALFRSIGGMLYDRADPGFRLRDWNGSRFSTFNDYNHVHPFAVALCPPWHIWERFIFDGDVCEVQEDGTLKRTPLEQYDPAKLAEPIKPYPFLHIINPEFGNYE
jgi:hypothetical protein